MFDSFGIVMVSLSNIYMYVYIMKLYVNNMAAM